MWQAGPARTTSTSSVSPSQSTRTASTASALPLVAPFCHSSPRDRLQKVARPLSTGLAHGVGAGPRHHQHLAGGGVLADARHEALRVEADLRDQRIGSPRLRHVSFTSLTV